MNAAPSKQQFAKLLEVCRANGIPMTPPHPDGFGGSRDAAILASYDREGDFVFVQAVKRTKDLLNRAGVKRLRYGYFYKVPVKHCSKVNGLQLNGEATSA